MKFKLIIIRNRLTIIMNIFNETLKKKKENLKTGKKNGSSVNSSHSTAFLLQLQSATRVIGWNFSSESVVVNRLKVSFEIA